MEDKELQVSNLIKSMLEETSLNSKRVYDGKLLQVYLDEVKMPNGSHSTRDWIKHPGASAVVPVFEDGTIMLLKQYRYPLRKVFAEVPAGKLDPGERPETTARRELIEETGLICTNLSSAGHFYPSIGYADEVIHVYVAWGLSQQEQKNDDDEFILNYRLAFSDALKMIDSGEISDGKTICALTKAYLWWIRNSPFNVSF